MLTKNSICEKEWLFIWNQGVIKGSYHPPPPLWAHTTVIIIIIIIYCTHINVTVRWMSKLVLFVIITTFIDQIYFKSISKTKNNKYI